MKTIIKISISLILLSFIFPFISAQAAGNAIMRLTSVKTDYFVGDTVYVQIQVETNGESINTVRSIMDFSGNAVLQANDFVIGTAWPNLSPGKELDNIAQHINVGGFILVDSVSQNSLFGTLIFKANTIGSSTISFALGSHLISPDQEEKINLAGCQPITINVIGAPLPPPPQNQAPIFQPIGNRQINLGEQLNFNVSATDPDSDLVNLTWNIPAGSLFTNVVNDAATVTGNFNWTPTAEGIYTITFTATDNNLDSKTATLTILLGVNIPPPPVNHPPTFQPIGEKTVNAGETLTFNVIATDPDGDNINLTFTPLDSATFTPITSGITSTSKFTWMPQNFGIYYVVFTATDDAAGNQLSSTQSVRITVFGGKCPPCTGGGGTCPICECKEQTFDNILELEAPSISSPSHSDSDLWYSNNSPEFIWETRVEPIGYSFNLDQNSFSDPAIGYYFSKENAFNFGGIADGIWFFHIKAQYAGGWGPTAHYQVKIDTEPPEFFKPNIIDEYINGIELQQIVFSALDKLSGVFCYEMKIDDKNWQKVVSPYTLNDLDKIGKIMSMRAIDNAGNAIEANIDLQKLIVLPEIKIYNIVTPTLSPPSIERVVLPYKIGSVTINNLIIVAGHSIPNSIVTLYVSTEPELVLNTQADDNGEWRINIEKELGVGQYKIYAIASFDGLNSLPSESVSLNLVEKYIPPPQKQFFWWPLIILSIIIIILSWLLRYVTIKINEKNGYKKRQKNKYGKH
ncbi:hypothetical protein JW977_00425 [Candidatus Falkowbacteria bacterium]|nr:hypothetical protein [Candidatus Falkowbacteria bacterium]